MTDLQLRLRLRHVLTSYGWLDPDEGDERVAEVATAWQDLSGASLAQLAAAVVRPVSSRRLERTEAGAGDARVIEYQRALQKWRDEVRTDERWTTLPSVLPDEPPQDLDDVHIEVYAVARESSGDGAAAAGSTDERNRQRSRAHEALLSVPAVVARARRSVIFVGDPGSGKSTLLRWLCRTINLGRLPDFELALHLELGRYYKAARQGRSPLAHFFDGYLSPGFDGEQAADWLRESAQDGRTVLLLDGLDEVPRNALDDVRAALRRESQNIKTVVTSRPGFAGALRERQSSPIYELAGLSLRARSALIKRRLSGVGLARKADHLIQAIRADEILDEVSANPFLLTLLTQIAAVEEVETLRALSRSRAALYRSFAELMRNRYNALPLVDEFGEFTIEHRRALERLAFGLLDGAGGGIRYRFNRDEMERKLLPGASPAPLHRSRFLRGIAEATGALRPDDLEFIHASFQEFFAAEGWRETEASPRHLLAGWMRAADRLIILEFVAGDERARTALTATLRETLAAPDRFGVLHRRAARLAAIMGLEDGAGEALGVDLREVLWQGAIAPGRYFTPNLAFIADHVALDAADFLRRLKQEPMPNPDFYWQVFIESAPRRVLQDPAVVDYLRAHHPDLEPLLVQALPPADSEIPALLAGAADLRLPPEERTRKIEAISMALDEPAAARLMELLQAGQEPEVNSALIYAIGGWPAPGAVAALVQRCLEPGLDDAEDIALRNVLRRDSGAEGSGALDPAGRDELLRFLALAPPEDTRRAGVLYILAGMPFREGGELLLEIVAAGGEQAELAAECLARWTDRRGAAGQLIDAAQAAKASAVQLALVHAACSAGGPVDPAWLAECCEHGAGSAPLRAAMFTAWARLGADGPVESARLQRFARSVLQRAVLQSAADEVVEAVFESADVLGELLIRPPARELLETCAAATPPSSFRPYAALRALTAVGRDDDVELLSVCLTATLERADRAREAGDRDLSAEEDMFAGEIAQALLAMRPACALEWPEHHVLTNELRGWAHEQGWLVLQDRILDGSGTTIAGVHDGAAAEKQFDFFIIYESQRPDVRSAALELYNLLLNRKKTVFLDVQEVRGGGSNHAAIVEALQTPRVFIQMAISNPRQSDFVAGEIDRFRRRKKSQPALELYNILIDGADSVPAYGTETHYSFDREKLSMEEIADELVARLPP